MSSGNPVLDQEIITGLELRLWNLDRRQFTAVSFERHSSGDVKITVGGAVYSSSITDRTSLTPPGEAPEYGVTALAGSYRDASTAGSILIVVNCGQEPPVLQLSARPVSGAVRASTFEITHSIQSQILDLFGD